MLRTAARHILGLLPPKMRQSVRDEYQTLQARRMRKVLAEVGAQNIAVLDINHLLHHLRGEALARLPKGAKHFVSVGCSGTWYFNWIEQMCMPLRHTGIEFYTPRPCDLPANVEWIANTAGNMEALGDGVADLLFSGQNIEHLWPDDIADFLLESHRVLRDSGLLVIDSPNRRITAKLEWSQPEHTIELDLPEILELLDLAGFDVERKYGLWLCEALDTCTVLPFEDLTSKAPWPLTRRVVEAKDHVESSFIWWVEARRRNRQPQVVRLRERIKQIFDIAWPERLNRLKTLVGRPFARNGAIWFDSDGRGGALLYGPYTALQAGRYTVTFTLEYPEQIPPSSRSGVILEVTAANGTTLLARCEPMATNAIPGAEFTMPLEFSLANTSFSVEFRVMTFEGIRICAKKAVSLVCHADKS